MKKKRIINNILIVATVLSPMISFATVDEVGERSIFAIAGTIRYSWIMWLFIPIPILLLLMGIKLKKDKEKRYKINFIIAFLCILFLAYFGSSKFIRKDSVLYDPNKIAVVEEKAKVDLPNEVKIATVKMDTYDITYAKIIDQESKENFEKVIKQNSLWKKELSSRICNLLPTQEQPFTTVFDYFMFYNVTSGEYNTFPSDGEYEVIFIAYDFKRIMIIDNYTINVN